MRAIDIVRLQGGATALPGARNIYLPATIDLIDGEPYSIYWLGLAHLRAVGAYTFEFSGPGSADTEHWTWTPSGVQSRRLTVRVYLSGVLVGRVSTTLRVRAATGYSGTLRLNFIGDSITATNSVGAWTNIVTRFLTAAGFSWSCYGSLATSNADAGVRSEGHPGRTYAYFNADAGQPVGGVEVVTFNATTNVVTTAQDVPTGIRVQFTNSGGALPAELSAGVPYWTVRQSATTSRLATSLANALAGTPLIDLTTAGTGTTTAYIRASPWMNGGASYVAEFGAGVGFTDTVIALGVNDFGSCREDHPEDFEAVIASAEGFIAKVRAGSPSTRIYICSQYNPSSEDDDFGTPGTTEAAQYDLRRLTAQPYVNAAFAGREDEEIYLVALHASCDPAADFDDNNVHPNDNGHERVGRIIAGSILGRVA